jgi:hypothetical protein
LTVSQPFAGAREIEIRISSKVNLSNLSKGQHVELKFSAEWSEMVIKCDETLFLLTSMVHDFSTCAAAAILSNSEQSYGEVVRKG